MSNSKRPTAFVRVNIKGDQIDFVGATFPPRGVPEWQIQTVANAVADQLRAIGFEVELKDLRNEIASGPAN